MIQFRSVRQKLTLWYVGVLAVVLVLFGGVLYASVSLGLRRDVDKELRLGADGIIATIFAFQKAEEAAARISPGNWESASSSSRSAGERPETAAAQVRRWADKTGTLQGERLICVVDRSGRVLTASSRFEPFHRAFSDAEIHAAGEGQTLYKTVRLRSRWPYRLIIRPVNQYGRVRYLLQMAVPLAQANDSLRLLRFWLIGLIPLTLVLASIVGLMLTTRALRPLDRVAGQVRGIGAQALDRRIDVPGTRDELDHLAEAFNGLLERVEQTFRRQRQFSAAASHELRTPLTVMKGELELALRRPRTDEEYQQTLQALLQTIDEMTGTVEEMLLLARSDSGAAVLEWQPVDLSELVGHVSETWRKAAHGKEVQLEVIAGKPVQVRGEGRLLERLAANLLDNAVRHTPAGGTVSIRSDFWRDKAILTVQDTGPGIPAEELPRIFDRFFHRAPDDRPASTGLGLGLCRWIVEAHRGRIEVNSTLGQGTTFRIWLPRVS